MFVDIDPPSEEEKQYIIRHYKKLLDKVRILNELKSKNVLPTLMVIQSDIAMIGVILRERYGIDLDDLTSEFNDDNPVPVPVVVPVPDPDPAST